jgi:hypothetical protein
MNCAGNTAGKIFCLGLFFAISISRSQIPNTGSDLPSLSNVQWGMSMREVKDRIARHMEEEIDTTLTFQDSLFNSSIHVILTFGKADSEKGLKLIEIQFDEKNAERLRYYLITRYGKGYETEKKEKTKLFFTVRYEASKWIMKNEDVVMIVFSQGDKILALSLLYRGNKK